MPEDKGDSLSAAGQRKAKMSLVEKLAITAIVIGSSGILLFTFFNGPISRVQNPLLLDNLALICYFVVLSSLGLLLWNVRKRQKSAQRDFKSVGFWLMAAAWTVLCVVVLMALFDGIVAMSSYLPSTFESNLVWVAMWVATGALIFMFFGFAVWIVEAGLRAGRDFRRWLDSQDS